MAVTQEDSDIRRLLARLLDHRHFLPCCFAVFVATRACLVLLLPVTTDFSDAGWYLHRAISIASGRGYSEGDLPTAYWPIGYPAFLGALFFLFGPRPIVGQVGNIVLGAGSLLLVISLSRYLFRDERIARISAALLTLYPNHAAYAPFLFTETYFTFLVLLGSLLFLKGHGRWSLLACGVVFGLASLTKPQVVFLPAFLVVLRLAAPEWRKSRNAVVMAAVALYAALGATMLPWTIRNTLTFGEIVLVSTNGGATLLTGNNPSARGDFTEDDREVRKANFSVKDQVAADRRARELAVQWIENNPQRFLALVPLKIWRLWAPDGEAEWWYQRGFAFYDNYLYLFRAVRIANQVFYVLLISGFLVTLALLPRLRETSNWPYSLFPYLIVAYLTAISVVFSGQSRFHFPAVPWIVMTVGWLLDRYLIAADVGRSRLPRNGVG